MKIIILQGSPNKNGSTAMLSEEFTRGAKEAGHNIERIDIVEKKNQSMYWLRGLRL